MGESGATFSYHMESIYKHAENGGISRFDGLPVEFYTARAGVPGVAR